MEHINFSILYGVATIELNRSAVLNSFNRQMALELQAVLDDCESDDSVRVIVLSGAGRAFCAGQDLAEAIAADAPPIDKIVREHYNPIVLKIRNIEKPVIAAVNGVAAGAGANLALACDLVIAAENASFIQSFSNIGLIPDTGGTYFLPRLIGMQRATALLFLADKVSAQKAVEMGMIYACYPAETFVQEVSSLANKLAQMPTKGLGLTKRALNASMHASLTEQLKTEELLQLQAANTFDNKEGINAFLEKRKANFIGK